jgi:integrase
MTTKPIIHRQNQEILSNQELVKLAFDFASKSSSVNTRRTYKFGWQCFCNWCLSRGGDSMQSDNKETLVAFFVSEKAANSSLKVSSIKCYLSAIRGHYENNGVVLNLQHPVIKKVLTGIRKSLFKRPTQKEPLHIDQVKEMVGAIPFEDNGKRRLIGIRDRAILLLGFAGAFRRSELVIIKVEDLTFTRDGFVVLLLKSKSDQEGEGMEKAIPFGANPLTCPVRAVKDWLEASKIQSGYLFRSINRHSQLILKPLTGHSIARIVKRSYPEEEKAFCVSGHSLRAGFVTTAARKKVPEHLIMKQTGHKCSDTLKRYIRLGTRFDENAAALVGL